MGFEGEQELIPDTFNFAVDVVDAWAADPERTALIEVDLQGHLTANTYAEVARRSEGLAQTLLDGGIGRGDFVIVMLPRIAAWQIALVACLRIGAVPIPSITMLTTKDLEYRIENSGARAVITTAAETAKFESISGLEVKIVVGESVENWLPMSSAEQLTMTAPPAIVGAEDPAILYYTSGSTGMPKGVLHAARALYVWRRSAVHWLDLQQGDVIWCTADTGWSKAGTSIIFGPWSMGATAVFHDGPFDTDRRFEILRAARVNVFCAAATELRRLAQVEHLDPLADLRLTVSAGESVNPEIVTRWRQLTGSDLLDGYGQTETLMTVTNSVNHPVIPGSMGRPLPGVNAGVLTAEGTVERVDALGQLVIRASSPQIMLGYYRDPERTSSCFIDIDSVGWFLTGDNVEIDADGNYFYTGRADDIINSSGYRIGPQEVENALLTHPSVLESAVVGAADPERGEIVVAFVVLTEGVAGDVDLTRELQDHVKTQTAPYKYPRRVEFVDELPKTITGKIRRNVLRQSFESTSGSSDQ